MHAEARLTFTNQSPPDAADVGHYLFLFRGVYVAAILRPGFANRPVGRLPELDQRLRRYLQQLDLDAVGALFAHELGTDSLSVRRIAVQSPLEIVMVGIPAALALAVIISGGKIKFDPKAGSVEAELPALADGIRKLREVLTKRANAPLDYGIRPKQVTLSPQELKELLKFDPASEKRGGFQRVLIGMQFRVNRKTRELQLLPHDIEVIIKHGRNPRKGGWQSSIKKIFGRHFDLNP